MGVEGKDGYAFEIDAEPWARWDAEAERVGVSLEEFVGEAVEARLAWNGRERRRDHRSLLDATQTTAAEHRPTRLTARP